MSRLFATAWREVYEANLSGYTQLLSKDPFLHWKANRAPEMASGFDLMVAVRILCADGDVGTANRLLERAVSVTDRAIEERKYEWDQSRAFLLRQREYARCLLGQKLRPSFLREAAELLLKENAEAKGTQWNDQTQSYYLAAVRLFQLIGDTDAARAAIQKRRGFSYQKEEAEILRALSICEDPPPPVRNDVLRSRFDSFFDMIRDPRARPENFNEPDVQRLEFGALRDRYFASADGSIDWRGVIAAIAR